MRAVRRTRTSHSSRSIPSSASSRSPSSPAAAAAAAERPTTRAQIAQREKEIIAATWKQDGMKNAAAKQAAEQAKFLSDVQTTLRSQAYSLAGRLGMRDLQTANEQFGSFQREMEAAAVAMGPAASSSPTRSGAPPSPRSRKPSSICCARKRRSGRSRSLSVPGAAAARVNSAGRDLASLFDLELDTQKNQYESAQTPFNTSQRGSEIEDALRKLDELARRQSELAAQRNADAEQSAEERWQQEMLRRKADELQQQIEQLARNGQKGQQGQQGGSSQSWSAGPPLLAQRPAGLFPAPQGSQGSQGSSDGQNDGQSGESGRDSMAASARQALSRLRQAEDEMRRAVDEHNSVAARARRRPIARSDEPAGRRAAAGHLPSTGFPEQPGRQARRRAA